MSYILKKLVFESTILYSRIIVYVKDYFQIESTNTLPMVTLEALYISAVCSSEPDLGMVGFI